MWDKRYHKHFKERQLKACNTCIRFKTDNFGIPKQCVYWHKGLGKIQLPMLENPETTTCDNWKELSLDISSEVKQVNNWYNENIETQIRELVYLLRNNGYNTYDSCEDSMHVSCELYSDLNFKDIDDLLRNGGYDNFKVNFRYYRKNDILIKELQILLPMKDGYFLSN